ncbi:SPAC1F5.02, partial [Symbiodinium necroappetens]
FPSPLPVATTAQSSLVGTVLFNFAFTSTLPSWVNEKKAEVSVGATFWTVMGYVVVTYTVIGVVGGMAYPPFYTTDENLFSKLNAGGSRLGQATVAAYPMLQNVTSIP